MTLDVGWVALSWALLYFMGWMASPPVTLDRYVLGFSAYMSLLC